MMSSSQVLRGYETREAELCLTLIHCLLLQTPEFTERMDVLVKEVGCGSVRV